MNKTTLTVSEYRQLVDRVSTVKKRGKFGNVKTLVDGEKFDSKKEARRFIELRNLQSQGLIHGLKTQVAYSMIINGQKICRYVADFVYYTESIHPMPEADSLRSIVVEDVKSDITRKNPVYRLKKKLMKALHNIEITEI